MIRVSRKHGLNPSLDLCFWCGEARGLVLWGQLGGVQDKEALKSVVTDKTPCPQCQEWMSQGVMFLSVKDGEVASDNPYRTGRLCVIKDSAVENMPIDATLKAQILKARFAFVEDSVWEWLGIPVAGGDERCKTT